MKEIDLDRRRIKALRYIASAQNGDGSFDSLSSPVIDNFDTAQPHQTVLSMALILRALCDVDLKQAEPIRSRLAEFLAGQASQHGGFNYWTRSSRQYTERPYPDDLDDTACAWLALAKVPPVGLDAATAAKLARLLVAVEVEPGGPYRTWLVADDAPTVWRDIDVAVNANIWAVLRQIDVKLPALEEWLLERLGIDGKNSTYYPGWLATVYFLAEQSDGELRVRLRSMVELELEHYDRLAPMEAALVLSAAVWLGLDKPELLALVDRLVLGQDGDGSWPAHGLCFDPTDKGKRHYAGSSTLTTALVLQALALWGGSGVHDAEMTPRKAATPAMYTSPLWPTVRREMQRLPVLVQRVADPVIGRVQKLDRSHGVTMLPAHILQKVPPVQLRSLDMRRRRNDLVLGSLYGWLAYTAADDIVDGDAVVDGLPLIQAWTVEMRSRFWRAVEDDHYQAWVDRRLKTMMTASMWELHHAHFKGGVVTMAGIPETGWTKMTADRAGGHVIASIGALVLLGYRHDHAVARSLASALRHIVIARQLHDDAHDWRDDLMHGRLNQVAARVLRREFAGRSKTRLRVADPSAQEWLRQRFWQEVSIGVLHDIDAHLKAARQQLDAHPELSQLDSLYELIHTLQNTTQSTRHQRDEALRFLQQFTSDSAAGR